MHSGSFALDPNQLKIAAANHPPVARGIPFVMGGKDISNPTTKEAVECNARLFGKDE